MFFRQSAEQRQRWRSVRDHVTRWRSSKSPGGCVFVLTVIAVVKRAISLHCLAAGCVTRHHHWPAVEPVNGHAVCTSGPSSSDMITAALAADAGDSNGGTGGTENGGVRSTVTCRLHGWKMRDKQVWTDKSHVNNTATEASVRRRRKNIDSSKSNPLYTSSSKKLRRVDVKTASSSWWKISFVDELSIKILVIYLRQ